MEPSETITTQVALQKDRDYIVRAWDSVAEPTVIVEGDGAVVRDLDGREYIDCSSGLFVMNLGHRPDKVVRAICEQANRVIQVSMRQTTLPAIHLAEMLAKITPGPLCKTYYTTSGTESNEAAIKMAKIFTGKYEIIALKNAYHGLTLGSLAATSSASYRSKVGPLMYGVVRAPNTYCYRCPFSYPACDIKCAREIEAILKDEAWSACTEKNVAAVIIEPVQGAGGIIPPPEYLPMVREICTRYGILLILDEVQTAFGRTGRMFACEHWNVTPDILTLAKGVGGGIPLGAVVTTSEIAAKFIHATTPTSSGNAVACAAGLATIQTLMEENIPARAAEMGQYLKEGLSNIEPSEYVGEVRFLGLMGGVEFVADKKTREPFSKKQMALLKQAALEHGIIVSTSGPLGNVFRVQPPLTITKEQADRVISGIEQALRVVASA